MSGIMLNLVGGSFAPSVPTVIGQAFGGGFWAGQIGVSGVATHNLVVGPLSTAQSGLLQWKNAATTTVGADSVIDGPQNTADMVADGNATVYPCAHFCNNAVIGGFSDWYMPAKNELEVCYFNLKPGTNTNNTSSGINPNAVPARASNYTNSPQVPSQTAAAAFQTGNSESFNFARYWSSSEVSATNGLNQSLHDGDQYSVTKVNTYRVRCIRRVPV